MVGAHVVGFRVLDSRVADENEVVHERVAADRLLLGEDRKNDMLEEADGEKWRAGQSHFHSWLAHDDTPVHDGSMPPHQPDMTPVGCDASDGLVEGGTAHEPEGLALGYVDDDEREDPCVDLPHAHHLAHWWGHVQQKEDQKNETEGRIRLVVDGRRSLAGERRPQAGIYFQMKIVLGGLMKTMHWGLEQNPQMSQKRGTVPMFQTNPTTLLVRATLPPLL